MAYTPPNTFTDGTVLTGADLEGNAEALRVYLHRGVVPSDIKSSAPWIETRHVQPPSYEPYAGIQHGVTGHQGGQWAGGTNIRLTFATKFLSGNGRPDGRQFHPLPQTALQFQARQDCHVLFHWWYELENGPDKSTASYQDATAQRRVYVVPYTTSGTYNDADPYSFRARCQETRNVNESLQSSYPIGLDRPFVSAAGYSAKQGTMGKVITSVVPVTFGLAIHSLSDRCGVVNWGVSVETFYF